MRIAFLSALYPPYTKGGGELSTHYIARGLTTRGHTVHVFTAGQHRQDSTVEGITVTRLPLPLTAKPLFEKRHSMKISQALRLIFKSFEPFDIYHAHDFRSALAFSHLSLPHSIVTARDYAQICGSTNALRDDGAVCTCSWSDVMRNHRVVEASLWRKPFRIWQYKYNIGFRKSAFQVFRHQIFISHAQFRLVSSQQDLSRTTTHVIYNPVSEEYLKVPSLLTKNRQILFVGTVEDYKGVEILLHAFHKISSTFPDIHVRIVGEGAQRQKYERLVASWGLQYRVSFTGPVPWNKLRRYYDEALLVVAPHIWTEPFGRTVVEAMARGKIVITSNSGGPAEIIQDAKTGLLVKPGSIDALSRKLTEAIKMSFLDRKEMQNAARTWIQSNLSPDTIAAKHERVYEHILTSISRP